MSGDTQSINKLNLREVEKAMQILLEGYKRVKKGESDVKLSDVLKSVNIEVPEFIKKDEPEIIVDSEEKQYEVFKTKSKNKLPSPADTYKSAMKFAEENLLNPSPEDVQQSGEQQKEDNKEEEPEPEEDPIENEEEEEQRTDDKNEGINLDTNEGFKKFRDEVFEEYRAVLEDHIGRYLPGFRHYENFESYSLKHPQSTIEDYYDDINREATLEEYIQCHKTAIRLTMRIVPHVRYRVLQVTDNRPEKIEMMLESEEYTDKIKEQYSSRIKEFLSNRTIYKLVD